jgi:hypothetical protein
MAGVGQDQQPGAGDHGGDVFSVGALDGLVVVAEAPIYLYAHDTERRQLALSMLKKAFVEGIRTDHHDWSFAITLDRATKDGHPNLPLLNDLTKVANNDLNTEGLDKYTEWSQAYASPYFGD